MALVVKNPPANARDIRDISGFDPWVGKIPWRREWQPTLVFLPGESHGQRSLVGYSPLVLKELDMTAHMYTHERYVRPPRAGLPCPGSPGKRFFRRRSSCGV